MRQRQKTFFDAEHAADMRAKRHISPIDPNALPEDTSRLTGQNLQILERLQRGPATNRELAAISLKYTSRISDIRAAGYCIPTPERKPGGLSVYRLSHERDTK